MSQENCARRPKPGQFKKGDDPRRHKFTPEACSKGFWAAVESIVAIIDLIEPIEGGGPPKSN